MKSRLVLPFWYLLTWVVPEKGLLNGYDYDDDDENIMYVAARSVNYRPLAAELIVPSGLPSTSSASSAAFNSAPAGNC